MSEIELDIYNILNEIDVLKANMYYNLLNTYGEDIVNCVIEKMIETDVNCLSKFDYYVSKISHVDDVMSKNSYTAYTLDINSIPVLTREENIKLASEIYEIIQEMKKILALDSNYEFSGIWISDDVEAFLEKCEDVMTLVKLKKLYSKFIYKRNMLTEGNLKLVVSVSRQHSKKGIDMNEIIQFGNMGLMKACERYDPSFNTCFSTYAFYWIRDSITKNLPDISCPVSVSYGVTALNISIRKSVKQLGSELGRNPTILEIAKYMDLPFEKVVDTLMTFNEPISLNEPMNCSDGDDTYTLLDFIEDEHSNVFKEIVDKDLSRDLMNVMVSNLSEKELDILCHRYELDGYPFLKLQELGTKYGLSRQRVKQIEARAINKLRRCGKCLSTYLG